jgi:hypothetical protein
MGLTIRETGFCSPAWLDTLYQSKVVTLALISPYAAEFGKCSRRLNFTNQPFDKNHRLPGKSITIMMAAHGRATTVFETVAGESCCLPNRLYLEAI